MYFTKYNEFNGLTGSNIGRLWLLADSGYGSKCSFLLGLDTRISFCIHVFGSNNEAMHD